MYRRMMVLVLAMALILGLSLGGVTAAGKTVLDVANMLGWSITEVAWKLAPTELPDIEIRLNEFPFKGLLERQIQEARMGTGAIDVTQGTEAFNPLLVPFTVPIEDFFEKDPEVNWGEIKNQLWPIAREQITFNGKVTFYPIMGGVQIGYYRKSLFEDPKEKAAFKSKYGYELAPPRTMQQFLDVASFFTRDTNKDGQTDLWGLVWPGKWDTGNCVFEEQLFRAGLEGYVDEKNHCLWGPAHPENHKIVEEIAKFNQDLIHKYKVVPRSVIGMEYTEAYRVYESGQAAMCISWLHDFWGPVNSPAVVKQIGETGTFTLDFLTRKEGCGGFAGFWGWGINKDSDAKDKAYEFIKWYGSVETQKKILTEIRKSGAASFVPARMDIAKWAAENGAIPPASYKSMFFAKSLETYIPHLEQIRDVARQAHEELLDGKISPAEFVKRTGEGIEKFLKENGYIKP